jgi:hypothetical protein
VMSFVWRRQKDGDSIEVSRGVWWRCESREKGRRARKIIFVLALVELRRVWWIMSVVVKGG